MAPDPDEITPAQRMAAGAMAGAVAQATIYPFELVGRRLICVCLCWGEGDVEVDERGGAELWIQNQA